MEAKRLYNLPILEDDAVRLFEKRTTRRSRGKPIDLRVVKLRSSYIATEYEFFWVQYVNSRPQFDLLLRVMSGEAIEGEDIRDGDFWDSLEEKYVLLMKRTEKIADRVFLLNREPKVKFLAVATEAEAKTILETEAVYLASVRVKNGKYAFPVWVDAANRENGYRTVSLWGRKQTMKEVDFINRVETGEKLYRKTFTVAKNAEKGVHLTY
ncbi:MAG: hypothetical protein LBR70_05980 [Lactobacillaceae bacterium]|jgi:hypothetical protein|nr:hypothetical protein [Lactobacillaceae bacterium]